MRLYSRLLFILILMICSLYAVAPVARAAPDSIKTAFNAKQRATEQETVPVEPETLTQALATSTTYSYTAYLPFLTSSSLCPQTSSASFDTIQFQGSPYKDNRLTDENADFRLSLLGYAAYTDQFGLGYSSYGGGTGEGGGPRMSGIYGPNRGTSFVQTYQVYRWTWDENGLPPYGSRGTLNSAEPWKVMVIDIATTPGEYIHIPERDAAYETIDGVHIAMVLYAGEQELTLAYFNRDHVLTTSGHGYVVHMLDFCVDPNLLSLYRAQLDSAGKRSTMHLPALYNDQPVGTALGSTMAVAIRDGARYMDPRVKTDWWYDLP